jgi:hypothetical protein
MKRHWPIVALSVIALAAADTGYAAAKKHHHSTRAAAGPVVPPSSSFAPPRMYEARPGVWISTWDCITDEGYGRWRPCSSGGGKAGM